MRRVTVRRVTAWLTAAGVGFGRACVMLAVSMVGPVLWAAAVALGLWWGWGGWIPGGTWAAIGTVALSRRICDLVRSLVARWTGTVIPGGYLEAGPVVRMSTGYWWNGYGYERTASDARHDQELRNWWHDPAVWRDLRFALAAPVTVGVIAAVPPAAAVVAVLGLTRTTTTGLLITVSGLAVAVGSAPYAWRALEPVAVRLLGSSSAVTALTERVDQLTAQRADMTVMQAAELRRIERDLHDGAQARLVALGLSLATAERLMGTDPEAAKALMREARTGAAASLAELRELVRGISPPVLNERGLVDAVRALALDNPLTTTVHADDTPTALDPPLEAAVYFGVAELLTNAAKHARATQARITMTRTGSHLVVEVQDDGRGGAAPRPDGGLAGLQRRLAAFDATLEISSPPGGPTRARIAVPCES